MPQLQLFCSFTYFLSFILWCVCMLSGIWLFATPWTVAFQVPLFTEFSRQEYWNGLPFPTRGDLPDLGTEPASLPSPALAGRFLTAVPSGKPLFFFTFRLIIIVFFFSFLLYSLYLFFLLDVPPSILSVKQNDVNAVKRWENKCKEFLS